MTPNKDMVRARKDAPFFDRFVRRWVIRIHNMDHGNLHHVIDRSRTAAVRHARAWVAAWNRWVEA